MIDFRWVLTAAHCIHEGGTGSSGWFSGVHVYPRRTINYTPSSINAISMTIWTEFFLNDNWQYDQGWIELESSAGVGFAGWGWNNGISVGNGFTSFGYPSDKLTGSMWHTAGDLDVTAPLFLRTDTTDTAPGHSGAPWLLTATNTVYAVHRGGITGCCNFHIRITQSRFETICTFMDHLCGNTTPAPTEED